MTAKEPVLGIARDIHDTHKHGGLERPKALIKSGDPPRLAWVGAVFQPSVFQNNVFQAGNPELQIRFDDGSVEMVRNVIEAAFAFWRQELDQLKL